jgi:alkanesulfonate monooxygenase SsuD/methylene tetrahydromethanopterin reductase-like flavin-dependent oxidoreductase (luciferase family)
VRSWRSVSPPTATDELRVNDMRLGLVLPIGPLPMEARQLVQRVDAWIGDLGDAVSSLWVTDHLQWGDEPMLEAWTTLAYAAARWPRLDLGTVVLGQSYRNPGLLAKMAATLQVLTDRRLIVGIGAGWKQDEYESYGFAFPSAGTRVDELNDAVEILHALWTTPGPVTVRGAHHQVVDAWCEPKPDPPPTLMVGGGGARTMAIAARRAEWWSLPDCDTATYADRLRSLHHACDEVGRDRATLTLTWFGRLAVAATTADAVALSAGRWTPERAIVGTPSEVVARIDELAALGVSVLTVEILGLDDPVTHALLHEHVLPRFT